MMNAANLGQKERYQLCKEAYQCATLTDGLTVITRNGHFLPASSFTQHLASVWTWTATTTTTRWRSIIVLERSGNTGTKRVTPSETASMMTAWILGMVMMPLLLTVMDP